jgi:endonuclease-3
VRRIKDDRRHTLAPPAKLRARPVPRAEKPFDVDEVLFRIRTTIKPFRKAAMFELADDGFSSLFEQLIACIISIRTRDETTVPTAKRLFEHARTPEKIAKLSWQQIDELIGACTFHQPKSKQILAIARRVRDEFQGQLPCDFDVLTSFAGVGPKCAGLALGVACGQSHISVDIHVHRVANRWGFVQATSPEQTMAQLQSKLPKKHWTEINPLLVPFGKHVCTGILPNCSRCPVLEYCRQVGVTKHR